MENTVLCISVLFLFAAESLIVFLLKRKVKEILQE